MKIFTIFLSVFSLSILCASCTKEVKYSKEALLAKAQKADPSVTYLMPRTMADGIKCEDYSSGCISGHMVRVQNLTLIAVEFHSKTQAIYAAKKYRGFYSHNWFFDDVAGEPVLEKFVTEKLEAKKP